MDALLTASQVAKILNCKVKTVYSWSETGKIPSFKINGLVRFVPAEIAGWLESLRGKSNGLIQIRGRSISDVTIDNIINKAIADTKNTRYNSSIKGKPDKSSPERRG